MTDSEKAALQAMSSTAISIAAIISLTIIAIKRPDINDTAIITSISMLGVRAMGLLGFARDALLRMINTSNANVVAAAAEKPPELPPGPPKA